MVSRGCRGALLLGVMLPASLAAQRFEGVLTVRVGNMPPGARMQYFIKGDRYRLELSAEGRPPIILISDTQAKRQILLFEEEHTYAETSFDQIAQASDSARRRGLEILRAGVMTPVAGFSRVAGLRCAVNRYHDSNGVLDICLTTELGVVSGTGGLFGTVTPVVEPVSPPDWVVRLLKTGAFALRVVDTSGAVLWEVLKAERKSLDPALFVPPPGYKPATPPPAPNHG